MIYCFNIKAKRSRLSSLVVTKNRGIVLFCLSRSTMYAYTKFATVDKDFVFLECLLFGALISATDPGMSFKMVMSNVKLLHSLDTCNWPFI